MIYVPKERVGKELPESGFPALAEHTMISEPDASALRFLLHHHKKCPRLYEKQCDGLYTV